MSPRHKPLHDLIRHRFARDVFNPRRRRSVPQPVLQRVERLLRTAGEHLDAAISKVLRVTGNAELQRLLARGRAKEHALHVAANDEACACHYSSPANSLASGTFKSLRKALLASTMASRAAPVRPTRACCIVASFNGKR